MQELAYVKTTGTITMDLESQDTIELGTVSYERSDIKGDALMAYLNRHGTPLYVTLCFLFKLWTD